MFAQTSSKSNSTSSVPAKRQRSYSQESINISTESSKSSNDCFMDIDSGNRSLGEFHIALCNLGEETDEDDDDIDILLDPSQLDVESQFVYEMCNISTF
ncbi:hypothetical protein F4703DRAFT_1927935 [Phycomyces blakesleeanus]